MSYYTIDDSWAYLGDGGDTKVPLSRNVRRHGAVFGRVLKKDSCYTAEIFKLGDFCSVGDFNSFNDAYNAVTVRP